MKIAVFASGEGTNLQALLDACADGRVRGELPLPQPAIFADTGWEPAAVYDTIAWLRTELADRIPLHVVRKHHPDGSTANIRADTLAAMRHLADLIVDRDPIDALAWLYCAVAISADEGARKHARVIAKELSASDIEEAQKAGRVYAKAIERNAKGAR